MNDLLTFGGLAVIVFCSIGIIRTQILYRAATRTLDLAHEYNMRAIARRDYTALIEYDQISKWDGFIYDLTVWRAEQMFPEICRVLSVGAQDNEGAK